MLNSHRVDAIIASAYNLAAADDPSLRRLHPNGMRPAEAAQLPNAVRVGWIESYAQRLNRTTPAEQRGFLFHLAEVYEALATERAVPLGNPQSVGANDAAIRSPFKG